jgi:hypothetical protein
MQRACQSQAGRKLARFFFKNRQMEEGTTEKSLRSVFGSCGRSGSGGERTTRLEENMRGGQNTTGETVEIVDRLKYFRDYSSLFTVELA